MLRPLSATSYSCCCIAQVKQQYISHNQESHCFVAHLGGIWKISCVRQNIIKADIEKIYAKLVSLETEVTNLRNGYVIVNKRYTEALTTLKTLTQTSLVAAKRAAVAAEKASHAAKICATAAKAAAEKYVIDAAEAAASAAAMAAEAAIQAAAAASASAAAAAAAVAEQAEESLIAASAEASVATRRAAEAAADAVRMSNLASESAKKARQGQ